MFKPMIRKNMKRIAVKLIFVGLLSQLFIAGTAFASSEPHLGEITLFPYNFEPRGYMLSYGRVLPINQNTALFSLLGVQYGGNGTTTFALPDLRGASPTPQVEYYIAIEGIFPSRN